MNEHAVMPLPALGDEEGRRVPDGLPPVVDAHVHVFPPRVFEAVWRWFDRHGWPIRYKLYSEQVLEFLFSRGVSQVVALHYAHKPGLARSLNAYVAELCRKDARIIGMATVLPGEPGAGEILREAFDLGLSGVKLHCHVQCISPDAPVMHEVYAACVKAGKPLVIHAGRQPSSPGYACDTYAMCQAERIARVLSDWPTLRVCVPHLGADEYGGYEALLERFENLWLDTTMVLSEYFPFPSPLRLLHARPDRILYGTDFPGLPYAWDRELKKILSLNLPGAHLESLLGQNALKLYAGLPKRGEQPHL